jgi:hypothetical protein
MYMLECIVYGSIDLAIGLMVVAVLVMRSVSK